VIGIEQLCCLVGIRLGAVLGRSGKAVGKIGIVYAVAAGYRVAYELYSALLVGCLFYCKDIICKNVYNKYGIVEV
jgi:hypothetical protein